MARDAIGCKPATLPKTAAVYWRILFWFRKPRVDGMTVAVPHRAERA
jgi:hypothetical protein